MPNHIKNFGLVLNCSTCTHFFFTYLPKLLAVVGIMVTASHNPKDDDGYKVYWNNGCQIRSPVDQGIANSILSNLEPWVDYGALVKKREAEYESDPCLGLSNAKVTKEMIDEYFAAFEKHGLVTGQNRLLEDSNWKPPSFAHSGKKTFFDFEAVMNHFNIFG